MTVIDLQPGARPGYGTVVDGGREGSALSLTKPGTHCFNQIDSISTCRAGMNPQDMILLMKMASQHCPGYG